LDKTKRLKALEQEKGRLQLCSAKIIRMTAQDTHCEGLRPERYLTHRCDTCTGKDHWYAKLVFVRRVPLIICISERLLLPVIVEARVSLQK
jgi:hypothetical protein